MPIFAQIASKIIQEQELVIGPLAWSEAQKVSGMQVAADHSVTIQNGDPKAAVDRLVAQYERLFGRASHEVCREAAASIVSTMQPSEVPSSLLAA
ncbi:MAG TPA: hypothetical protein VJG64_01805 [Candidatus Paceibacterota bacterium]